MKKRGRKGFSIKINFTNKWLYSLIAIFVFLIAGVVVYAVAPNPGHTWAEVGDLPAGFADGVDNDYCTGGTCAGGLTVNNGLTVNDGLITINNVEQFMQETNCLWYDNTPDSDWCGWISAIVTPLYPHQTGTPFIVQGANWVCCKYNSPSISCGTHIHVKCRFYYKGSITLGARDPVIIPTT
jgi:hypothetical protein